MAAPFNVTHYGGREALDRRGFLAGAGVAVLSAASARPNWLRAEEAASQIKLGIIGCGGRGTWIARLFKEHGGFNVVAGADYFRDRVDLFGREFGIPESHRFTGLTGYRALLDKVDAVAIESPPYFHPAQAAAAVEAGRHVYLAKPVAVDVPGCQSVARSGRQASANNLCFLVDFQTRADPFYIEALRRVHDEQALGRFAFGEASYHATDPFRHMAEILQSDPDDPESRLRAWGLDKVLSGDIITEQNIHALDVMNWVMDAPPLWASGTGGRKFRPIGTCYDTFSVLFQYPGDVGVTFSSRQLEGHGTVPDGIRNRMFGTEGVLETAYGGQVLIRGSSFYRGGSSPGIYRDGVVANIRTFHQNVVNGLFDNPTVAPSVRSNLITLLGRTAAYEKRQVEWCELLDRNETLEADLKGLKS